jgi:TetR/AcrR family fatty acid metabolism transcriptional regulator
MSREASILAAATRVFAQSGYHGARMAEVARAAGVADGTVYLYFRGKRDLFVSLFEQGFADFLAGLDAALASAAEPIDVLCAHHLGYLGTRYDLAVVTQVEMRQSDPELRQAIGRIVRPYFERIEAVLAGRAAPADVKVARRMVFGTLDEHVTAWVRSGGRFDLAALAPEISRLLRRALGGGSG